ncbi:FkbM family methyltransferase [Candidatus Pelagibacter sp. HIMB1542]|uniref:FkbM family methyltransferase n=1 Tax=Candidatus Pelagibacter sp. HIMB1542 TaxID=3413346 RepID=UPI003F859017
MTEILISRYKFVKKKNLVRLGSIYGGWTFENKINLSKSTILSCGLGEDASFDIEFANKYNANIIIVDPTPRSKIHFNKIIENLGNPKKTKYNKIGNQEISSYDLSNIKSKNLIFIEKALYNKDNENIKFFKPPDKKEISHSINNWQNDYSRATDFIEVSTITIKSIMKMYNIENIPLLKIDIEGAEIEVIENILMDNIKPKQICVEFDELNKFNYHGKKRFIKTTDLLIDAGYQFVKISSHPNFLFTLDE